MDGFLNAIEMIIKAVVLILGIALLAISETPHGWLGGLGCFLLVIAWEVGNVAESNRHQTRQLQYLVDVAPDRRS